DTGCSGADASPVATCAWTQLGDTDGVNGWKSYSPALKCWPASHARDYTDEQLFDCDYADMMIPEPSKQRPGDGYAKFRAAVQAALAARTVPAHCGSGSPRDATTAELTCLLQAELEPANTGT